MTKISKILEHLQTKKNITQVDAYKLYGSLRLSSIIFNLRDQYNIITNNKKSKDRFGNDVRYAEYVYKGKIKQNGEKNG